MAEARPALPPRSQGPTKGSGDLHWLARYARHCGYAPQPGLPLEQGLRAAFGPAAWRILCRSPKAHFLPILRSRGLSLHSLVEYCRRLADNSFVRAPRPALLAYFVSQRRLYYSLPCRIPQDDDYVLMRVAERACRTSSSEIALVVNWVNQANFCVRPQHRWRGLVRRAREFRDRERVMLEARAHDSWYFYCRAVSWRGYQVNPITDAADLWQEGMAMGNCLYMLKHECTAELPSRFFSVRQCGRRVATLELGWKAPVKGFWGMDRSLGRWDVRDLRLSLNRLPLPQLQEAMESFAQMYNCWSKRPARWSKRERGPERVGRRS